MLLNLTTRARQSLCRLRSGLLAIQPELVPVPRCIDCMELEDRTLFSAVPLSPEALVNTTTANAQATQPESPQAVASDANGNYVVTWTSQLEDGSGNGVFAQRYNSAGQAQGSTFQVNQTTADDQQNASVAMDDAGNFVVTWSSNNQDGDGWGVYARRYDSSGVAQGGEFLVNTAQTSGNQQYSVASMDDSGNFVIAWSTGVGSNSGIRAQRYDSAGTALGGQIQVNATTTDDQIFPSIGSDSSGNFVITWSSNNQDGSGWGVYARRFNADGTSASGEFLVNTQTSGDQNYSRVAVDDDGNFLIVWTSSGQAGDGIGVYAQGYNSTGTAQGSEFRINSTTADDQQYATVTADDNGRFFVAWESNIQDGAGRGIYVREFDLSGTALTGELLVNETISGDQRYPSIAADDDGDFVVVWSGNGAGDTDGIFARRYMENTAPTLDASKSPALAPINEDAGGPSGAVGTLVSALVDFASPLGQVDNVTDPDSGALLGIAVTAADTTNGTWWYSINNGSNWLALGAVTNTNARLLAADANTRLYFQPNPNYNGSVASAITFRAWDRRAGTNGATADTSNNGGSYAFSSATDTASLTVIAVNDVPTATITPASYSVNEQTMLTLHGTGLSIADIDAGSSGVQAIVSVTSGALSATAGTTGVTISGSGTSSVTLSGTLAQINNLLAGNLSGTLTYINSSNTPPASDTLTLEANDLGNTGTGGALTASDTATINITAVNDGPTATITLASYSVNEQTTLTLHGTGLSIADADAGSSGVQAIVSVTSGTLSATAGTTGVTISGSGTSSVTLSGTLAQINNLLAGNLSGTLSYINNSNTPPASDTLTLQANDLGNTGTGGALTASDTATINITAVNDGPTATITLASYSVNEQTTLTLHGTGLSIADADAGSSGVQAIVSVTSGTLSATAGTTGVTISGSGTSSVTLSGTLAQINNLLAGNLSGTLSYINNSNTPPASDTLTLQANDLGNTGTGGALTSSDTATINITAVNDAPTATITPASYSVNEQTTLTLHGTGLSIADADAGSSGVQAIVSVTSGTLSATAGTTGVTIFGSGTSSVTLSGTLAQISNLLAGNLSGTLSYINNSNTPPASDTLTLAVNDLGNTGTGGALTASDTATINITAVNDAPTATITPASYSVNEQTTLTLHGTGLSVADVDAGSSGVQAIVSVTSGTLSATAGTTGVTISGSGTSSVTLSGTLTQIINLLAGNLSGTLTYISNSNTPPASDTLTLEANDLGNTGTGGALTASDTATINVTAVNDAPVNGIPGAQTVNEDSTLVLSSVNGNAISIADIDAAAGTLQVTLSATNGTITLAGLSGLAFSSGDGTGDAAMTFTGALTDINAALDGLSFSPTGAFNGAASLQIVTTDQGNTGSGGALSDTDTVNITVNAVNNAPVNNVPSAQTTSEDAPLIFSAGNSNLISISDLDVGSSPVQVTLAATNGSVTLSGISGLSFTTGDGTADATMTFTGTVSNINAALDGLSFNPTTDFNGAASLQIVTNDLGNTGSGGPLSDTSSVNITINAVNDAPANSVPGPQSTNEDTTLVFSVANGNAIAVSDVDAGLGLLQVTLTASNGTLNLASIVGLSFSSGDGAADSTMTFTGTAANINAALNGLSFSPLANFNGAASLQIVSNDQGNTGSGGALSDTQTVSITVNAVNDGPTNSLPGPQATNEDTDLVFSAATGNAIVVSDLDAGASSVQVTLAASNGTLSLASVFGLSFTGGDGAADATMSFTGSLANINAALDGLVFAPTADFNGAASLQITTNDLGNTGSGGALADADTVTIAVDGVNDAPVLTVPAAQATNEDTSLTFSSGNGNAVSVSDVDAAAGTLQVTLSVSEGWLTLAGTSGLTIFVGDGVDDPLLVFAGSQVDINAALDGLQFLPTADFHGVVQLEISVDDQGNAGTGGALTDARSLSITVASENDAPTLSTPATQTILEDNALILSTLNGNALTLGDVDADGGLMQLSLTASHGTISLGSLAGLIFNAGDGVEDVAFEVLGTLADLNAAIENLRFDPDLNYNGPVQLQVVLNDLGHAGAGGALEAAGNIDVDIVAVNDAPVILLPAGQTLQGTTLVFSTGTGNPILLVDPDAADSVLQLTLAAAGGTFTLAGTTGLTVISGGTASASELIVSGTIADLNAALNGLTFQWSQGLETALTVTVDDLASASLNGPQVASSNLVLTPPLLIPPPAASTSDSDTDSESKITPGPVRKPAASTAATTASADEGSSHSHDRSRSTAGKPLAAPLALVINQQRDDEASGGFAGLIEEAAAVRVSALSRLGPLALSRAGVLDTALLWGQLDALSEQLTNVNAVGSYTIGAAAGATAIFSAGYVAWCLRSGTLLASALSSLPTWRNFDPLPVLDFWEKDNARKARNQKVDEADESLENLLAEML